jgi:hypothetical protein
MARSRRCHPLAAQASAVRMLAEIDRVVPTLDDQSRKDLEQWHDPERIDL